MQPPSIHSPQNEFEYISPLFNRSRAVRAPHYTDSDMRYEAILIELHYKNTLSDWVKFKDYTH